MTLFYVYKVAEIQDLGKRYETNFRYLFAHRDDPNREMIATVLSFGVPAGEKE